MLSSEERFEICKPYFQLLASAKPKDIKTLLGSSGNKKKILVCCFAELAVNFFVRGKSSHIKDSEKKYLRHFSKNIIFLAQKRHSFRTKFQEVLVKNPGIVKILSRIALAELWSDNLS